MSRLHSFKPFPHELTVNYGGGTIRCHLGQDKITIGELVIDHQHFGQTYARTAHAYRHRRSARREWPYLPMTVRVASSLACVPVALAAAMHGPY